MRRISSRAALVLAASFVAASMNGCNHSSGVIQPLTSNTQADVQVGVETMAAAAPSVEAAAETLVALIAEVQPAPVSPPSGPHDPSLRGSPTCAPVFDLGNGVSGTCEFASTGEVTFTFAGSVDAGGESVSLQGTLVAFKPAQQPATGARYDVDFAVTTSGPRGAADLSSTASVTVDDAGAVIDFALVLSGTVTSAGGQDVSVSIVVGPTQLELTVIGPRGGVLLIALDRVAMTGTVTLNGIQVAAFSVVNGCAVVDAIVPELENGTFCP